MNKWFLVLSCEDGWTWGKIMVRMRVLHAHFFSMLTSMLCYHPCLPWKNLFMLISPCRVSPTSVTSVLFSCLTPEQTDHQLFLLSSSLQIKHLAIDFIYRHMWLPTTHIFHLFFPTVSTYSWHDKVINEYKTNQAWVLTLNSEVNPSVSLCGTIQLHTIGVHSQQGVLCFGLFSC